MEHKVTDGSALAAWFRAAGFLFILSAGLSLGAAEITWTGEGETPAWSDGGNWEGGVAPSTNDVAVIPADTTMIGNDVDFNYANATATKWASSRFESATAVLVASNMSASVTHTVPLVGAGEFRAVESDNKKFTMNADNSDFTGSFYIKRTGFLAGSIGKKALGLANNKIIYYGNNAAKNYFQWDTTAAYSNEVHIYKHDGNRTHG